MTLFQFWRNYFFSDCLSVNRPIVLEPCEGKLSCSVLRGEGRSNPPDLPDLEYTYRITNMIDHGLNEKVVLVTGGNNPYGIGAAIARNLPLMVLEFLFMAIAKMLKIHLAARNKNRDCPSSLNNRERVPE